MASQQDLLAQSQQTDCVKEINFGLKTAFIDATAASALAYRPAFLSNDRSEGKKVLASIEDELLCCDEFKISVAFITMSGLTPLLQTLRELEIRHIPGQILTTNYLSFSEPAALEKLSHYTNIQLKMYDTNRSDEGFHTKGYIFRKDEIYRIIIGSSNLTAAALTTNREWNTKIVSTEYGEMAQQIIDEFNSLWSSENALDYEEFIDTYRVQYSVIKKQREIARQAQIVSLAQYRLQPNSMQTTFIANLQRILEAGERRALLISATGTGKTFASAFAMRELGFKKVLFLVHRGQLAIQTKTAYEKVFGHSVKLGIVGAGYHDYDADYIFATVQTLRDDARLKKYPSDAFDAIVLDEAHHVPAKMYDKILDHFTPKLWLGMTATPDRRQDKNAKSNVYELFDYQIAHEIRLQQAMEENLLCPFHYFGISDLAIIGDEQNSAKKLSPEEFRNLVSDERIRHVVDQADYYGFSGDRVKGLIFCSRIEESQKLSEKLNQTINPRTQKPFRTMALNGDAPEDKRKEAFERLAMNEEDASDEKQPLDYILSVDILNEGVDIVEVNQVIMLRPTQSPIVFIQQLGRGLRKADGKEYVVVLDFIGNYEKNFLIPIALSGDRTYNKDNIRRYLLEGGRIIPGASTIHFDEVSRKQIFASIDTANFSDIKLIKENYTNLKNKLGRIPALKDFDDYGEMDVLRIFDNKNLGSYYAFLVKYEKEYKIRMTPDEAQVIKFVSEKLASGKRVQELLLLRRIMAYSRGFSSVGLFNGLAMDLQKYGKTISADQKTNIINVMTNKFPAGSGKSRYSECVLIEESKGDYIPSKALSSMLQNQDFYDILKELVDFGISRYERDYRNSYADSDLVLYQKYTYEDACRLLNWENNEVPLNIGGYKYDKKTKTFPVFINYEKEEDITATTKYEDHFVSNKALIAISKSGRKIDSEDVQNFLKAKERGINVELFVRKNKDDKISKEFYYLGRMNATGRAEEFIMDGTDKSAVRIEWALDEAVREDIYEYIVTA